MIRGEKTASTKPWDILLSFFTISNNAFLYVQSYRLDSTYHIFCFNSLNIR